MRLRPATVARRCPLDCCLETYRSSSGRWFFRFVPWRTLRSKRDDPVRSAHGPNDERGRSERTLKLERARRRSRV